MVTHEIYPNPECRDGKHTNCDGRGWNSVQDEPCECPCPCHSDRCDPATGHHSTPHKGCILR